MDTLTEARAVLAPKQRVSSDTLMTNSFILEPLNVALVNVNKTLLRGEDASARFMRVKSMIEDECRRQKLAVSPNLWHPMIMYTSRAIARRELAETGRPGYRPYVDRYDQLPPVERSAFERDWQPYLDGKAPFQQALHDLVRDAR